ncbi:MAG: hypothetical protein DMG07_01410 [Acidobacteria bacterium]|nr:MAG: hypothetical protein DMG07_01410 [Acidobacteriota bacterium]
MIGTTGALERHAGYAESKGALVPTISPLPAAYAVLMIAGTRIFPITAVVIPHYPQVAHHRWPELARRLDPHFAARGLRPVKLLW